MIDLVSDCLLIVKHSPVNEWAFGIMQQKDFITMAELSEQTGINRYTLLARIRKRKIPTITRSKILFIPIDKIPLVAEPVTRPFKGGERS